MTMYKMFSEEDIGQNVERFYGVYKRYADCLCKLKQAMSDGYYDEYENVEEIIENGEVSIEEIHVEDYLCIN